MRSRRYLRLWCLISGLNSLDNVWNTGIRYDHFQGVGLCRLDRVVGHEAMNKKEFSLGKYRQQAYNGF
jgi:hypothetical protein